VTGKRTQKPLYITLLPQKMRHKPLKKRPHRTPRIYVTLCLLASFLFSLTASADAHETTTTKTKTMKEKKTKSPTDRFREKMILTIPISIDVLLLGLDDSLGSDRFLTVDREKLKAHLDEAFGTFEIDTIKGLDMDEGKIACKYEARYEVRHGISDAYERRIGLVKREYDDVVLTQKKKKKKTNDDDVDDEYRPRFVVDGKEMDETVEKLIKANRENDDNNKKKRVFTIVIVLPSATRILFESNSTSAVDVKEFSYTYGYALKNVDYHLELRAPKRLHRKYQLSSAFVGRGRYAVIDLRAESPFGKEHNTWVFPTRNSIVEPFKEFLTENSFEQIKENFDAHVHGELGKTIFDGVRSLYVPDIAFETMNYAKRVLVPIIALRDHAEFDPLDPALEFVNKNGEAIGDETKNEASINLQAIEREVRKFLLPGQDLIVVSGTHELHSHHHIASSIARAKRHSVIGNNEENFIKFSKRHVLEELRMSSDSLAAGLSERIESTSTTLYAKFGPKAAEHAANAALLETHLREEINFGNLHTKRSASAMMENNVTDVVKLFGTKVIPVYVLSLASYGKGVALGDDYNGLDDITTTDIERSTNDENIRNDVASDENLVVVIQDASEITKQQEKEGRNTNPNPTRDIVAGLAKALGALPLPFEGKIHRGRDFEPLLWAVGCHPFGGDLSNTEEVSDVISDAGRRNHVVSRIDSAARIVESTMSVFDSFAFEYVTDDNDNDNDDDDSLQSLPSLIAREFNEKLENVDKAFSALAVKLSSFEDDEGAVHRDSDLLLKLALEFAEDSRLSIENARVRLGRCRLRREKGEYSTMFILLLFIFSENLLFVLIFLAIVIVAILSYFKKNGDKRRHHQQQHTFKTRAKLSSY